MHHDNQCTNETTTVLTTTTAVLISKMTQVTLTTRTCTIKFGKCTLLSNYMYDDNIISIKDIPAEINGPVTKLRSRQELYEFCCQDL